MDDPDPSDILGNLERQVFLAILRAGKSSVAEIVDRLATDGRPLAYTTVMTVMTRLWEKGYLLREREGKAYLYEARTQQDIASEMGARAIRDLLGKYGKSALMGFVRTLSPEQREAVARLLEESGDSSSEGPAPR